MTPTPSTLLCRLAREFTATANGPHERLERQWAVHEPLVLEMPRVIGHLRSRRR